jgi:hypothetical protein
VPLLKLGCPSPSDSHSPPPSHHTTGRRQPCPPRSWTAFRAPATASRTPSTRTETSSSPSSSSKHRPRLVDRYPAVGRARLVSPASDFFSRAVRPLPRQVREQGEVHPAATPHPRRARRGPGLRRLRLRRGPLPRRPPLRAGAFPLPRGDCLRGYCAEMRCLEFPLCRRRSCCRRTWPSPCARGRGCGSTSASTCTSSASSSSPSLSISASRRSSSMDSMCCLLPCPCRPLSRLRGDFVVVGSIKGVTVLFSSTCSEGLGRPFVFGSPDFF